MKFTNICITCNDTNYSKEVWLTLNNNLFYLYWGGRLYFCLNGVKKATDILDTLKINKQEQTISLIYKGTWENCDGEDTYAENPYTIKFYNTKEFKQAVSFLNGI